MWRWMVLAMIPGFVQAAALFVDEFYCHVRRGLPRWERWGHPLDTLSVLVVNAFAFFFMFSDVHFAVFVMLAVFSCLFVTKDEWVHSRECDAFEHWLHSILFMCHPLTMVATCFFWVVRDRPTLFGLGDRATGFSALILGGQVVLLSTFLIYQIIYWNVFRARASRASLRSNPQEMRSMSVDPQ